MTFSCACPCSNCSRMCAYVNMIFFDSSLWQDPDLPSLKFFQTQENVKVTYMGREDTWMRYVSCSMHAGPKVSELSCGHTLPFCEGNEIDFECCVFSHDIFRTLRSNRLVFWSLSRCKQAYPSRQDRKKNRKTAVLCVPTQYTKRKLKKFLPWIQVSASRPSDSQKNVHSHVHALVYGKMQPGSRSPRSEAQFYHFELHLLLHVYNNAPTVAVTEISRIIELVRICFKNSTYPYGYFD